MMKISRAVKKYIIICIFACLFLGAGIVQAAESLFQKGVQEYRNGNAQECLEIMKSLKKQDPSNAYVEYYLAMSQVKLGNLDEAKESYEKVIILNPDSQLVSYAKEGIKNIEKSCEKEIVSEKISKDKTLIDKPSSLKSNEYSGGKSKKVSDDEVTKAIKVLRDAGLLNVQLGVGATGETSVQKPASDPAAMQQMTELMNMNMLMGSMGGGSKNSGMDMLPMLMMQQQQGANSGKSAISPELIQMMMNSSMLDGLGSFDSNDKDK